MLDDVDVDAQRASAREAAPLLRTDEDATRVLAHPATRSSRAVTLWTLASALVGAGLFACVDGTRREVKHRAALGEAWETEWGALDLGERATRATAALQGKTEGHGLPVFLHIPKAGGTTIETALGVLGIDVGYCHLPEARGTPTPYETSPTFENEAWHRPPAAFVPDSWAIVRNPYRRFASNFLWAKYLGSEPGQFWGLNPGYSERNCEAFQSYVKDMISPAASPDGWMDDKFKCYNDAKFTLQGIADCETKYPGFKIHLGSHVLPQRITTAFAERVFKFEECFDSAPGKCKDPRNMIEQDNIIAFMRNRYTPAVTIEEKINEWNAAVEKPDVMSCWAEFDPAILRVYDAVYTHDFAGFGYNKISPKGTTDGTSVFDNSAHTNHHADGKTLEQLRSELPENTPIMDVQGPKCDAGAPALGRSNDRAR